MLPSEYTNFFITTATAGGALIGLLFVAISLAPERVVLTSAPIESRIVAGSTFTAIMNAFFISLGALLPHTNIGWFTISFGIIGILNSLNQGRALLIPWPSWQNVLRRMWLTVLSLYIYIYELVCSIQLLLSPTNGTPVSYLALSIVIIYIIALLRAWELLGAQRTGLLAWLNPLYDLNKGDSETSTQQASGEKKDDV
ncbi:MAG: hypothetical protein H0V70_27905 [Ktedonobacteraceae bacterium]|nr:hypothetical protein [Ktedonobacteraceae bacterium]